jgi:hypothetical protein
MFMCPGACARIRARGAAPGLLHAHFPDHFDLRERGFASLNADVHYQTLDETFHGHIGRPCAAALLVRTFLRHCVSTPSSA